MIIANGSLFSPVYSRSYYKLSMNQTIQMWKQRPSPQYQVCRSQRIREYFIDVFSFLLALIRGYTLGQLQLQKYHGAKVLIRALSTPFPRLQNKLCFLINTICSSSAQMKSKRFTFIFSLLTFLSNRTLLRKWCIGSLDRFVNRRILSWFSTCTGNHCDHGQCERECIDGTSRTWPRVDRTIRSETQRTTTADPRLRRRYRKILQGWMRNHSFLIRFLEWNDCDQSDSNWSKVSVITIRIRNRNRNSCSTRRPTNPGHRLILVKLMASVSFFNSRDHSKIWINSELNSPVWTNLSARSLRHHGRVMIDEHLAAVTTEW